MRIQLVKPFSKTLSLFLLCYFLGINLTAITAQSLDIPEEEEEIVLENDSYRIVLDSVDRTTFTALVISPIKKITKIVGDSIVKGEILIELDADVFEANLEKAKANLERAKVELKAKKRLYEDGVISRSDYEAALALSATAHADHVFAKKNLEATVIKAPYNGKVVELNASENEITQPGREIITVIQDDVLIAKMLVPSSLVRNINIGDPVIITLAETGEKIEARISRIAAVIDPASSTLKVNIIIDNSQGKLKVGMTGAVTLKKKSEE